MNLSKATSRNARSGRALFLRLWFSYLPLYRIFVLLALLAALLPVRLLSAMTALELHSDTHTATAGYYQLRWHWPDAPADAHFVLQETRRAGDKTVQREIYSGTDTASVISGKPDGVYEYTVRALDAQQMPVALSERVRVVVEHHSLGRAVLFFVLGIIVFLGTLLVIMRGAARHKQE